MNIMVWVVISFESFDLPFGDPFARVFRSRSDAIRWVRVNEAHIADLAGKPLPKATDRDLLKADACDGDVELTYENRGYIVTRQGIDADLEGMTMPKLKGQP